MAHVDTLAGVMNMAKVDSVRAEFQKGTFRVNPEPMGRSPNAVLAQRAHAAELPQFHVWQAGQSGHTPSQVAVINARGMPPAGNPLWSDGPLQAKNLCRLNDQSAPTVVLCDVDFGNLTDHDKRKLFVGLPRAQKRVDMVLSDTAARALAGLVWASTQPQHIVLGVHGFNDYSKAFAPLAQHLVAELQATVYAYDQRGFGGNPQPGIWPGSPTLLADLRHIASQLRQRHPGLPLTVVGESMGGAVVWVAASEAPGLAADQIILKAPAVW
eukprot:gene1027-1007_t